MARIKYRIKGGQTTAKWRASAKTGLGGGTGLALVLGYLLARLDPQMPPEVLAVAAALLASWLTSGGMLLVSFLTRPAPEDTPEIEPVPPVRGIPE